MLNSATSISIIGYLISFNLPNNITGFIGCATTVWANGKIISCMRLFVLVWMFWFSGDNLFVLSVTANQGEVTIWKGWISVSEPHNAKSSNSMYSFWSLHVAACEAIVWLHQELFNKTVSVMALHVFTDFTRLFDHLLPERGYQIWLLFF